jgi:hypothetical protein
MSSGTLTPDRQTFRRVVADVAARAKERLPQAVNGRVESSVKLVLAGDVFFCADGTVEVGSASDPAKTYTLAGHACDCQDFAYGKAPEGWCSHRIAAGIQKRVQELLGADQSDHQQTETAATPQAVCDQDNVHIQVHTPPAPLPEARASVNVHLTIAGRQVQLTLRDHDEVRLLARLEEVLQRFPLPEPPAQSQGQLSPQQHNAAAMHRPVSGFCPVHNVQMKLNEKDGRQWWSHYDEGAGRWCKGKGR